MPTQVWHMHSLMAPGEVPETCVDANDDADGDGLRGCADPDCFGRCNPLCPPGVVCDATAPRCGNGTCNAYLEDARPCPTDCPLPPD